MPIPMKEKNSRRNIKKLSYNNVLFYITTDFETMTYE